MILACIYVQKNEQGNWKEIHSFIASNLLIYAHTLFLNIQARLTISVRIVCFVMLSCCIFSFPCRDNLIATSTVKLNISPVSVRPRKTMAKYEGLNTSLLTNIRIFHMRNVLNTNCSK